MSNQMMALENYLRHIKETQGFKLEALSQNVTNMSALLTDNSKLITTRYHLSSRALSIREANKQ